MKQTFKNYFKLGVLLLGISLTLVNCQKDDELVKQKENINSTTLLNKNVYPVKLNDIPDLVNIITREERGFLPDLEPINRTATTNVFGTIDPSQIMVLDKLDVSKTYTFYIIPATREYNVTYNLVMVTDANGAIIKNYIKKFISSNDTKFGATFTGTVEKYNLDGSLINETTYTDGKTPVNPDCADCSDQTPEDSGSPTGGGGSGGSGGFGTPTGGDTTGTGSSSGGGGVYEGGGSSICTWTLWFNNCGGNNGDVVHSSDNCGAPSGTGSYYYFTSQNCGDYKTPTASEPLPCCDDDMVIIVDDRMDVIEDCLVNNLPIDGLSVNQYMAVSRQLEAISSYLRDNCSPGTAAFALEAIDALENGTAEEVNGTLLTLKISNLNLLEGPYDADYAAQINEFTDANLIDPTTFSIWMTYFSIECAYLKEQNPNWPNYKIYWEASKEMVHLALDITGLAPVIGIFCDVANGAIYAIDGDGLNASLSFSSAIPITGWFTTGAKLAKKTLVFANGTKTSLKWVVKANGVISFGARNSKRFRKVCGMIPGDPRQAHHIIPWAKQTENVVQQAAKDPRAFHMDEALNGIPLDNTVHSGSHTIYDNKIIDRFNQLEIDYPNITPEQAYDGMMDIISDIRAAILANPTTHVNDLIF